mmetsp:Transcript_6304/g.7937  ORF Transcript_6304/g.7937 Transcript_6304/m.7937 type:complete len:84 (+) Transcript_6304:632-883(+)
MGFKQKELHVGRKLYNETIMVTATHCFCFFINKIYIRKKQNISTFYCFITMKNFFSNNFYKGDNKSQYMMQRGIQAGVNLFKF